MELTIDLREGFQHTPTVVRVDGAEVFRNPDLSTRMQIGLAAQVRAPVARDSVELQIELAGGAQRAVRTIKLAEGSYVGVELTRAGEIDIAQSSIPFGYV